MLLDDLSKIADPLRQDMQRSFYNTESKNQLFTKNFEVSKVTKTPNIDEETGAKTCITDRSVESRLSCHEGYLDLKMTPVVKPALRVYNNYIVTHKQRIMGM